MVSRNNSKSNTQSGTTNKKSAKKFQASKTLLLKKKQNIISSGLHSQNEADYYYNMINTGDETTSPGAAIVIHSSTKGTTKGKKMEKNVEPAEEVTYRDRAIKTEKVVNQKRLSSNIHQN